ncbi:hypothetical protein [Nostoc sp.]|uniref:hypothetical protein n=1 Tax=Nostoc sp. TaxID=1180 RepID=UPI002FFA4700
MKIRNAFATVTICVLSTLTLFDFLNPHKVEAESGTNCRQLVTGTYLTTVLANFGSSRGLTTFNHDGNFVATASIQSGIADLVPFSTTQGSWKCISNTEITATGLDFNYPTAKSPGTISRTNFNATFDPKNGIVQAKVTIRTYPLNANPLNYDAPVVRTFTFTGQRVKPGQ